MKIRQFLPSRCRCPPFGNGEVSTGSRPLILADARVKSEPGFFVYLIDSLLFRFASWHWRNVARGWLELGPPSSMVLAETKG